MRTTVCLCLNNGDLFTHLHTKNAHTDIRTLPQERRFGAGPSHIRGIISFVHSTTGTFVANILPAPAGLARHHTCANRTPVRHIPGESVSA